MDNIDRGFLVSVFGTEPNIGELNNARNLINEWICELEHDEVEEEIKDVE